MDKIERAREIFRQLEGCSDGSEIARRAFCIRGELAKN